MATMSRLAGALLITSALTMPTVAFAQQADAGTAPADLPPTEPLDEQADVQEQEEVEVSVPGGSEIVVTGRANRNIEQSSTQVLSVLSSEQIARTGEGNIAGALSRVTGLSVVGSGYVYVRGLGDRYSLALLNGSPLPSPEPLKRVVPLDLFPTGVIASSLVQKSYSANFPGEFGGGVINLTTKAIPQDDFLTIGVGVSGDSFTTGQPGLTYYGSSSDWTGYDNGNRDIAPALQEFFDSGERISSGNVDTSAIAGELVTSRNAVIQRYRNMPVNFSASFSGGKSFPLADGDFGVIAGGGYSNKYLTRQPRQQVSLSADLSTLESDFFSTTTDQRIVVNGLLGFGYEFGENTIRWTNLYIHDTLKQARTGIGNRQETAADFFQQRTGFYERQLIDTQLVGEFEVTPALSVEFRGAYANSKRDAPYELFFEYVRTNSAADPFGQYFVNRLNNGNGGDAGVTFSKLNEDLWSGGVDVSYELTPSIKLTVGGAYADTHRTSSRRDFTFLAPNDFMGQPAIISAIGMLRPDFLMGPNVVDTFGITMIETDEGNPAFAADLVNRAGYGKLTGSLTDALSFDVGVRYEDAQQDVAPIQVFTDPGASDATTNLDNNYWLPAATLTYEVQPGMQLRLSGSKTIARPQFRELINQPYYDPETNRPYRGNPLLQDSQLYNGEARFEYYLGRDERVSVSGFYKKIDNPIEAFISPLNANLTTSYANAPEAQLYGGELEVQKYFGLGDLAGEGYRRIVLIGNYTYTKSKLKVGPDDTVQVYGAASTIASDYFRDGVPLTGQSDHIVNLQFGLENEDRLSQQTFLLTYASERVVSRGLNGTPPQPDVVEKPGVQLDFVAREGFDLFGRALEFKAEIRNILGQDHEEYQQSGDRRIDVNSYDVGTSVALSLSTTF
ncbi:TonB-dependent receptor [Altererythrobacter soli]|uniref:TonB-dependent receptor n=1 Tax=Croceibacterium soli TaxID=1739690 RepID=A0A6I4UV04_9SPHN|nr:TonB-dependent receptor [Croceibacterium soli]MXP41589.1 TonB-dependent receptor [Croceibacterium soli]